MNYKRLLFSAIVATLTMAVGSSYALSNSMVSFTDIEQHWGKSAILSAADAGLVDGYGDGTFKPEQSVSRAEFIKMTATALKLKVGTVEQGTGWYKAYVKALTDAGIFRESDFAAGDMNTPITRLEISRIAVRTVEKGMQVKEYNPEDHLVMYTATKAGLIQGLAKGELALDGLTTRAQSVTIIDRMLKKEAGETLSVDKYAVSKAEIAWTGSNVESMLGTKPQNIGQTWSLGQGASATLNQLIIADPMDENDPFIGYVEGSPWRRTANKETDIVVLAKFTVMVNETADKNVIIYDTQHFTLYDQTGFLILKKEGLSGYIKFDQPGIYSGFVAYTVKKDYSKLGLSFDVVGHKVPVGIPNK